MLAHLPLKSSFLSNSRINLTSKPGVNKQRVRLRHIRASSPDDSEKNTKGSKEDPASNVTLKVVPALLSEQRGVGVIATVGVIAAAKLAQASIDGVAAAVEKDLKPALENPENLENWKKTMRSAVEDAKSNARKSMEQVGANFNEAMAELKASADAANEKMAKEAELGAINWEKTTSAITSSGSSPNSVEDKNMVAKLTEAEDKGTEILKSVGKEIKDMTVNRKDSLQTGWMSNVVGKPKGGEGGDDNNSSTVSAVVAETPASASTPPAPVFAAAAPVQEAKKEEPATPPSTIIPATTVAASGLDSSLDAVTKGGRHVSMLSAPMGSKEKTNPAAAAAAAVSAAGAALGFSKSSSSSGSSSPGGSSSSSSSPGASSGGSSGGASSARSGLDALKAAAGAGAVAAAGAAAVVASGGGDGGSNGGNSGGGGGGGGGSGGDGSSSGDSSNSDNNDGNKNNLYLLLLALALAGVGYYLSQQQAQKAQPATAK